MILGEQQFLAAMAWELPPAQQVLAFAPHPDDEVFGCGGALALLGEQGAAVAVVVVTDGVLGGANDDGSLAALREQESCNGAAVLGLSAPEFWRRPDRGLAVDDDLVARIVARLRQSKPDLVFLPAPSELHPDHQALAFAGAQALRQLDGDWTAVFYEVGYPLSSPNLLLDISAVVAKKRQAMRCFRSQLAEQPYEELITGLNCFRSYVMGPQVVSAEAFVIVSAKDFAGELSDLFQEFSFYRHSLAQRDGRIMALEQQVAQRDGRIMELEQQVGRQDDRLVELGRQVEQQDDRLVELGRQVEQRDAQLAALYGSSSWRLTAPLRYVATILKNSLKSTPQK